MEKTLVIYFNTADKKTYQLSLEYPKENLSNSEIEPVAQKIIDTQVFNNDKRVLSTFKKATYITREVSDIQ